MNNSPYSISKTSFLKFEQCPKAFFLYKNHPYLRDKISVDKQLTFKRGHDVGFFAQQLFPGGRDVSKETSKAAGALVLTASLIAEKTPVIYEATFVFNGVLIMVDILCLNEGRYTAYEVKSSLKVSDNYIKDACLQYYVLKNNLPALDDFFLVTINADYLLQQEVDPKKLFKKRSVKARAESNLVFFEHQVQSAHAVLEQNAIPNIAIGRQCFRPYQCDYFSSCWKGAVHEKSIFNLPFIDKGTLFDWYNSGIKNIEQLNDTMLEKELHIRLKNAFTSGEPIVDSEKIRHFLDGIQAPVAAMDMEIWSPAIPQIPGTRPFEKIPFLVCFYDGQQGSHFFTANQPDGRREFAQKLIELSAPFATLLVYDKTMELSIIDSLIKLCPDLEEPLTQLKNRFADVFDVFLNLRYYHPGFQNNFSLKVVAQHLLKEEVGYSRITSGLEAMNYFEQYRLEKNEAGKEEMKNNLVAYCETDTLATFKLAGFLKEVIK